jgi:hypothetical protein
MEIYCDPLDDNMPAYVWRIWGKLRQTYQDIQEERKVPVYLLEVVEGSGELVWGGGGGVGDVTEVTYAT